MKDAELNIKNNRASWPNLLGMGTSFVFSSTGSESRFTEIDNKTPVLDLHQGRANSLF
jgi:hypothetical protein